MNCRERQALDAAILALKSGTFNYFEYRHGLGVLRELCPEFADQLKQRRGNPPANDQRQRVLAHYTILNSPRYRESPISPRGPLPPPEIVKRIAKIEGITSKHVRALLADEFTESKAKREAEEKHQRQLESKRLKNLEQLRGDIRNSYEITINKLFDTRGVRSMASFPEAFDVIHRAAISEVAKRFATDEEIVVSTTQESKGLLRKRLEEKTLETIRYR